MASTMCSGDSTAAGANPDAAGREKADAAKLLDLVFGAEVLAAIHEGFLKDGDYRGVLPLLGAPATANAHVRAATQAAFEEACAAGEAGVAGLCLAHAGVAVDPLPTPLCRSLCGSFLHLGRFARAHHPFLPPRSDPRTPEPARVPSHQCEGADDCDGMVCLPRGLFHGCAV